MGAVKVDEFSVEGVEEIIVVVPARDSNHVRFLVLLALK